MTTTTHDDRRERALGAIATLMAILRPGWDIAGCVAALRRLPHDLPLIAVAYTALRYTDDPANLTPAHIGDLGNRAWESFDPWPCRKHPRAKRRSDTGECADCWVDANADEHATAVFDRKPRATQDRQLPVRPDLENSSATEVAR